MADYVCLKNECAHEDKGSCTCLPDPTILFVDTLEESKAAATELRERGIAIATVWRSPNTRDVILNGDGDEVKTSLVLFASQE